MLSLPRRSILGIALSASALSVALTGCGTVPPETTATPATTPVASATPTPSASATPSAAATPSATPTPSTTPTPSVSSGPADPAALTIAVTLADGKVTPSGEKLAVDKGQKVVINVTSDHDDAIHIHGFNIELEVKANQPATISFVADEVGSFEVESHHPEKIIAILNVS